VHARAADQDRVPKPRIRISSPNPGTDRVIRTRAAAKSRATFVFRQPDRSAGTLSSLLGSRHAVSGILPVICTALPGWMIWLRSADVPPAPPRNVGFGGWIDHYGKGRGIGWTPDLTVARLIRWIKPCAVCLWWQRLQDQKRCFSTVRWVEKQARFLVAPLARLPHPACRGSRRWNRAIFTQVIGSKGKRRNVPILQSRPGSRVRGARSMRRRFCPPVTRRTMARFQPF